MFIYSKKIYFIKNNFLNFFFLKRLPESDPRCRDEEKSLATSRGLLLNELKHAPASILEPLLTLW